MSETKNTEAFEKTAEQMHAEWEAKAAANLAIPRDEFLARFKARMMLAPFTRFRNEDGSEGELVADYADEVGQLYFDDPDPYLRREGPEACADADMSYWGE
jgi:hypothetical protein